MRRESPRYEAFVLAALLVEGLGVLATGLPELYPPDYDPDYDPPLDGGSGLWDATKLASFFASSPWLPEHAGLAVAKASRRTLLGRYVADALAYDEDTGPTFESALDCAWTSEKANALLQASAGTFWGLRAARFQDATLMRVAHSVVRRATRLAALTSGVAWSPALVSLAVSSESGPEELIDSLEKGLSVDRAIAEHQRRLKERKHIAALLRAHPDDRHYVAYLDDKGSLRLGPLPKDASPRDAPRLFSDLTVQLRTISPGLGEVGPEAAEDETYVEQWLRQVTAAAP